MSASEPVTFDPLDAPLWRGYEYFQSLADSVRASQYRREFWVDPKHWSRHKPPPWVFKLKWQTYRYCEVDTVQKLKGVAKRSSPGIYIFSVRPDVPVDGFPDYVLYVGISNATGSKRPVRQRLAEYLPTRISAIRKRSNIHRMACLYYSNLWVHFAYTSRKSATLRKAEEKLHGYLAPLAGQQAYPVDMKPLKPAF